MGFGKLPLNSTYYPQTGQGSKSRQPHKSGVQTPFHANDSNFNKPAVAFKFGSKGPAEFEMVDIENAPIIENRSYKQGAPLYYLDGLTMDGHNGGHNGGRYRYGDGLHRFESRYL